MLDFNKPIKAKVRVVTKKELAQCTGKVAFDSFEAATRVGSRERKSVRRKRNAYRCSHCRKYHLGASV